MQQSPPTNNKRSDTIGCNYNFAGILCSGLIWNVPEFAQYFDECELAFVSRGVPRPPNAASTSGTAVDRLMLSANLENEEKLKIKLESF